ncbi:ABC transporter permease subunit [Heyndrickxia oleronia]|jgi:cystine transport system permease protein|uniref:Cysteine ABC transporter permease n=1 Tax=Heyndrickxia oleronia TaxID=38875 RepID=A0A8E2I7D9_9BACI|nr:ABC transporter permease subunit [Heyndrickxia oleronia]OJH16751.1 cysteine ABC transporter permease [Bacillus obstructivus]MBU5212225.1 ABC transporter permease subunit [Heyndrickxia oleronia]MCM3240122.1 ABC transporter permease subunit [Heyndrickxia oleronia]MCM3454604.1 ABC transporter permease subunit [Heyndrickxia oleronia]MEC1375183.1 ABC transporter permease subunit [Heyndrickxia oleronia]
MANIQWEYIFDIKLAIESFPYVMQGIGYTVLISLVSMLLGLILGFFIALGRMSNKWLFRFPSRLYISFMRGVPILVFLFILYFGLPMIGIEFTAVTAAIIGFSLNSAAYMAEINRSAIASVDKGQWEAASSLGFTYWQTMRKIILPQAVKLALPPLSNVYLDLIKGTSLAAMITVPELFQKAKIVGGREYDYMTMYIVAALIYWGICSIISILQNYLEKRYEVKNL